MREQEKMSAETEKQVPPLGAEALGRDDKIEKMTISGALKRWPEGQLYQAG